MIRIDRLRNSLLRLLNLNGHPARIAAGFGVGIFISFTPFFGFHTPLAVAFALLFRLNKVATITGAWVNTPLTVVPSLIVSHEIGRLILRTPPVPLRTDSLDWRYSVELIRGYGTTILLGSSIIGFCAGMIGYALCYWLILRFRRKDPGLAELSREMEETGDDLTP
ncbi:MAG: DUF2062 domain-containing protein [Desulfuromonadia bacterium]